MYWLLTEDKQTYVGKAQCIKVRLLQHRSGGLDWAQFGLLEYWEDGIEDKVLRASEHFWIYLLKPSLNRQIPITYRPLTHEEKQARGKAVRAAHKAARHARKAA